MGNGWLLSLPTDSSSKITQMMVVNIRESGVYNKVYFSSFPLQLFAVLLAPSLLLPSLSGIHPQTERSVRKYKKPSCPVKSAKKGCSEKRSFVQLYKQMVTLLLSLLASSSCLSCPMFPAPLGGLLGELDTQDKMSVTVTVHLLACDSGV